jgi:hypothetical protein
MLKWQSQLPFYFYFFNNAINIIETAEADMEGFEAQLHHIHSACISPAPRMLEPWRFWKDRSVCYETPIPHLYFYFF